MKKSFFSAGTKVKVRQPGGVPAWSEWEDDHQRTSTSVKKRLQQLFFRGDRRILAQVVYIASDSQRDQLKSRGQIKVEVRDPAGASIIILADVTNLDACA